MGIYKDLKVRTTPSVMIEYLPFSPKVTFRDSIAAINPSVSAKRLPMRRPVRAYGGFVSISSFLVGVGLSVPLFVLLLGILDIGRVVIYLY